jgi:hypothetical protein
LFTSSERERLTRGAKPEINLGRKFNNSVCNHCFILLHRLHRKDNMGSSGEGKSTTPDAL